MRIVALIDHGPNWDPTKSLYHQGPAIDAHLAAMGHRYDHGQLLVGGPYENERGGIAVLDVDTLHAAQAVMDADPAVIAGVLTYELRIVRAYFDTYTGTRTTRTASPHTPHTEDAP